MKVHRLPLRNVRGWLRLHKKPLWWIAGGLFAVLMLVQLFYPSSHMPLFASVDGISVGGWSKNDVIKRLDYLSARQKITVTLGDSERSYAAVVPAKIGLTISHQNRIKTSSYPWYLRIVPTSLFWFGPFQAEKPAVYTSNERAARGYLEDKLGASCSIPAKDATLKLDGDTLVVVPATNGGTCKESEALAALASVKPQLGQSAQVTIPVKVVTPKVGNDAAKALADSLSETSNGGVKLRVAGGSQIVPQKEVLSWLTFQADGAKLAFAVDSAKANEFMAKQVTPKVSRAAGITKVSTVDFTETSRVPGAPGQTLALASTLSGIAEVLQGKAPSATVQTAVVAPKVEYSRSYSKTSTGIAALLQHYGQDNAGTFGVSFIELGGRGLQASYNSSRSFITASTYKLYVAYGTLKKVEAGEWKWSDDVAGGRNLSTCFDDMIVKSDNPCAEALYKKIGYQKVINDVRALGLGGTVLASDGQRTTAADLALFLTKLQNKTLGLKDSSTSRLIDAMKRNVYRSGIPAGASGAVADKVGFLNGLLHDASVVYSPKGTYVLVIMTDGSTWGNIAELTRKIEALR